MGGGTTEIHLDDDYLASGTHKGADGSTSLYDPKADFASCGVHEGAYIENVTQGAYGEISIVTERNVETSAEASSYYITTDDTPYITTDGTPYQTTDGGASNIVWNHGDTYKIYKTAVKGSFISSIWTDLSRGWKTQKEDMRLGWKYDDIDLDRDGERIFGPGQPE